MSFRLVVASPFSHQWMSIGASIRCGNYAVTLVVDLLTSANSWKCRDEFFFVVFFCRFFSSSFFFWVEKFQMISIICLLRQVECIPAKNSVRGESFWLNLKQRFHKSSLVRGSYLHHIIRVAQSPLIIRNYRSSASYWLTFLHDSLLTNQLTGRFARHARPSARVRSVNSNHQRAIDGLAIRPTANDCYWLEFIKATFEHMAPPAYHRHHLLCVSTTKTCRQNEIYVRFRWN